jgi:hypothetical protein
MRRLGKYKIMSNILLTYAVSSLGGVLRDVCFHEGLIKSLCACGNNVMRIFTNDLTEKCWDGTNKFPRFIDKNKALKDIDDFAPDIIIAFNFSCIEGLDRRYACPIIVMEADSSLYYNDKYYLTENQDRFIFTNTGEKTLEDTQKRLKLSPSARCGIIPFATAVESDDNIKIDKNISFIGSYFYNIWPPIRLHKMNREDFLNSITDKEMLWAKTVEERILTLNSISDLDLYVYGQNMWRETACHFLMLGGSYVNKTVYSLAHNQDIYNTSRICLNINHKQAIDGFAWRVMDIMASNGCLLTNPNAGIAAFTKGYVDIPTYHSPAEARDLAEKLLKDEAWRRDIVQASQACIADKGRWPDRLRALEALTGVRLVHEGAAPGAVHLVDSARYQGIAHQAFTKAQEWAVRWAPQAVRAPAYQALRALGLPISQKAVALARTSG